MGALMPLLSSSDGKVRRTLAALLTVLLPLAITLYTWTFLSESLSRQAMTKFSSLALESEKALVHRLASYDHPLDAGAGFLQNIPQLTRQGWRSFVDALSLQKSFPGLKSLGFIERVSPDSVPQFLERMRQSGETDFNIHPAAAKDALFVITHVEPIESNLPALGYNIESEQKRREAAMLAMESGNAALTGRIVLASDLKKAPELRRSSFVVYHPLYEGKRVPATVEERKTALIGWIYEAFIADNFLSDLTQSQGKFVNIDVFDGDSVTDDALVYSSKADPGASAPLFSVRKTLDLMQKRWTIVWTSTPSFERLEKRHEPEFVLVGGVIFSAIFGAMLFLIAQRKETVERLVAEQTITLRSQHRELEGARAKLQQGNDELEGRVKVRTAELQAALIAAKEADQAKSAFLSNMSHELRTPMHAILGYSDLSLGAIDEGEPDRARQYIKKIGVSGNRLLRLLNDLLILAKLEAGKIEYAREKADLKVAIDSTLTELAPLIRAKTLKVSTSYGDCTDAIFDKHYVIQVLVNLLSNAIKFSDAGGKIAIDVSEGRRASGDSMLCCRIADCGPGIPEGELKAIFDKFVQSSKTKTGAGGTGLGLAICQKIIEAHDGRIWAENAKQKGAVFTFVIPREVPLNAVLPAAAVNA